MIGVDSSRRKKPESGGRLFDQTAISQLVPISPSPSALGGLEAERFAESPGARRLAPAGGRTFPSLFNFLAQRTGDPLRGYSVSPS